MRVCVCVSQTSATLTRATTHTHTCAHTHTRRTHAKMVLEGGKHPGELKDMVCSPGGTTIAGVHELEKAGVRAAYMNAVTAAARRSKELSKL